MSNDYAIPPDASTDSLAPRSSTNRASYLESPRKTAEKALEKSGYLTKLGGKIKSWHKRYFVLKSGVLSYWKSQVRYYIIRGEGEIEKVFVIDAHGFIRQ